jgi:type II secretory pathway pseudopilin PulG
MDQEQITSTPSSTPSSTLPPPPPALPRKEEEWKNILTIIFLVLIPLVGIILMWVLATWSKKTKIIVTAILAVPIAIAVVGILASIVLVSMGGAREAARDAIRQVDMRQIVAAQEMYFTEHDAYFTSNSWPSEIGSYMLNVPTDPGEGNYVWIDNTDRPQEFCAYADLEKDGYYTASHRGNFKCSTLPTLDDCCFSSYSY